MTFQKWPFPSSDNIYYDKASFQKKYIKMKEKFFFESYYAMEIMYYCCLVAFKIRNIEN